MASDIPRNRMILWLGAIGAVLLVAGYLTADQWLVLLQSLLGAR